MPSNRFLWAATQKLLPVLGCLGYVSSLAACDSGESSSDEGGPPSTVLPSLFGTPVQSVTGTTTEQFTKSDVKRNDVNYYFMANGWGPGFESQTVSWNGTSFNVESMQGKRGANYEPATYPTVFCGVYSDSRSGECGLQKPSRASNPCAPVGVGTPMATPANTTPPTTSGSRIPMPSAGTARS